MKTVDKYQFNEEMATIDDGVQTFVAHHTILKRKFTLKLACQGSSNEKIVYNYLIKEAQVLKKLIHPNIYKCHKLLRSKNNFYVIFDNIEGKPLSLLIQSNISYDNKLLIIKQIIETLIFINSSRLAYLGLNPENIMVQENFTVVLKNFGNAEEFEQKAEFIDLVKFQGTMTKYSPPELEKNKVYINSDFYSLGVVINTLFEKEFEFGPPDKIKLTQKIKSGKEGIDTVLDLGLLKELADKMVRKNYVERSDFYEILRTRQCSSTISEKKSEIRGQSSFTLSPGKSLSKIEIAKSTKDLGLALVPELLRSRSIKNIDFSDKKELELKSVEQFILFIIKKRNFCLLLLNMSALCIRNREANVSTCLILSFLLTKKAAYTISQLAKLVRQGSNNELIINPTLHGYFKKTKAFEEFSAELNKEMLKAQSCFREILSKVKSIGEFLKNQALQSEVRYQKINNTFIKRTLLDFMLQLCLLPTEEYIMEYSGSSLYLLYILSLLSDYETYEQMFESLFTEGFQPFEKEPFIQQLSQVDKKQVMELIEYNVNVIFSEENYRSPLAIKNTVTTR